MNKAQLSQVQPHAIILGALGNRLVVGQRTLNPST